MQWSILSITKTLRTCETITFRNTHLTKLFIKQSELNCLSVTLGSRSGALSNEYVTKCK